MNLALLPRAFTCLHIPFPDNHFVLVLIRYPVFRTVCHTSFAIHRFVYGTIVVVYATHGGTRPGKARQLPAKPATEIDSRTKVRTEQQLRSATAEKELVLPWRHSQIPMQPAQQALPVDGLFRLFLPRLACGMPVSSFASFAPPAASHADATNLPLHDSIAGSIDPSPRVRPFVLTQKPQCRGQGPRSSQLQRADMPTLAVFSSRLHSGSGHKAGM
jgi:hypothetical protein